MNTANFSENKRGFEAILNELIPKDGTAGEYLVTRSREEYDRLLRAAMGGDTPDGLTLGRAGLRLDRKLIIPPDSILCC